MECGVRARARAETLRRRVWEEGGASRLGRTNVSAEACRALPLLHAGGALARQRRRRRHSHSGRAQLAGHSHRVQFRAARNLRDRLHLEVRRLLVRRRRQRVHSWHGAGLVVFPVRGAVQPHLPQRRDEGSGRVQHCIRERLLLPLQGQCRLAVRRRGELFRLDYRLNRDAGLEGSLEEKRGGVGLVVRRRDEKRRDRRQSMFWGNGGGGRWERGKRKARLERGVVISHHLARLVHGRGEVGDGPVGGRRRARGL